MSAMMISALKMTADRIALCGVARPMTFRAPELRVDGHEHRRQDREVLRDVVGDRERRDRAAGDQQLLADRDDLEQLRRVRVEVDHVGRLLGRRRPAVHRQADVGLGERRGVVRAVAGHRDEVAVGLLAADEGDLVLGLGLGDEVVDAGLAGDRRCGPRVVAGDHHGPDAHPAELGEALGEPCLTVSLSSMTPRSAAVGRGSRAASRPVGDLVGSTVDELRRQRLPSRSAAMASTAPLRIECRPTAVRTPLVRVSAVNGISSAIGASSVRSPASSPSPPADRGRSAALGELDDRAALRRLVAERRDQGGLERPRPR